MYHTPSSTSNPSDVHDNPDPQPQPPRKKPKRSEQDASQTKFYSGKIGCPANNPMLIKLDGNKSLSVAPRGRVVEEFPTILVWNGGGDPVGCGIESGVLIEVVDEGEGRTEEIQAEVELTPVQEIEAAGMVRMRNVPDNLHDAQELHLNHNTDIPQTIKPSDELASTGQSVTPKPENENIET